MKLRKQFMISLLDVNFLPDLKLSGFWIRAEYHSSRHTTLFQRLLDVYTTLPTSYRLLKEVERKLWVYWDTDILKTK